MPKFSVIIPTCAKSLSDSGQINVQANSNEIWVDASLDDVTYTTILSHTQADGDAVTKFTGASFYPARYFRTNVTVMTLNTATRVTVNVLAQ